MIDPLGTIVNELADDPAIAALVGPRVRGFEPKAGDAQGPGKYRAFVVVGALPGPRWRRVPIQEPRYVVRCYGRTSPEAWALYGACSDVLHDAGVRVRPSNGLGIFNSSDQGGAADKDPKTEQPFVAFVVDVIATTIAVA